MTEHQIVEGFILSLNQLIPNTEIRSFPGRPGREDGFLGSAVPSGFSVDSSLKAWIWFSPVPGTPLFFTIERKEVGLTENETKLLSLVHAAIEDFSGFGSKEFLALSLKFSSKIGFGDLLIAKFLDARSRDTINHHVSLFLVLQELSFRYYEDKRCSSGFVYTSDLAEFERNVGSTGFAYYPFDEPIQFDFSLFSSPASFRYVDGRNSYYVIDPEQRIRGIVRLKNPDSYSLVARLRNQHLKQLVSGDSGKTWVAFVGLREEVYVIVTPDLQIKWSRNHWQLRDRSIIFQLLDRFELKKDLHELFVSLLFALSEGGYGASILIPNRSDKLPRAIGKIDHTAVGDHLRQMIQRSSIVELNSTNSLIGIIASDGLTSISKDGLVLSCGDIIDISEAAVSQSQGGGRSQAGIAASYFGLSIKISQNGPISFYFEGKLLLQF